MPKHDGKVVFDLEVDDSHIKADVNKALSGIEKQAAGAKAKVEINVNANTAAAMTELQRVKAEAHDVENSDATVSVDAKTTAANTLLDRTKSKAEAVDNADPTVTAGPRPARPTAC